MTERYLSQIGTYTGDQMKTRCTSFSFRDTSGRWNSESAQKLASSVVNLRSANLDQGRLLDSWQSSNL